MTKLVALLLLACSWSANAKRIALTFDDAPNADTRMSGGERGRRLIEQLKLANVPRVTFFVNTVRAEGEGLARIQAYAAAGHQLANHTHSHPEINTTLCADFLADVRRADDSLSGLPGFVPWFRFPYLREGETVEKRDAARALLRALGYRNAYITINTYDWYMDVLYQKARRPPSDANLRAFYVDVLMDSVRHYDRMALEVLGRSPAHVLLLHENDLAALYVRDLIAALRADGWELIAPEDAYRDPVAGHETKLLFPSNPGRIGEIAREVNWPGRLWPDSCDERWLDRRFNAASRSPAIPPPAK